MAVVITNEQAKTVAKTLVDRWVYTYGILSRIHNDWGKSFDNQKIHHLCTMYWINQFKTTPYNPWDNSKCERLNQILHDLHKKLPKSQKPNWPAHLNSLVLAYNVMPNSTTGLQPYQLMFGCKAQTPCDNWLDLNNYDLNDSVSKSSWIHKHHKLMQAANQCMMKSIQKVQSRVLLEQGEKNCPS